MSWLENSKFNRLMQRRNVSEGELEETILEEFYRTMLMEVSMNRFKWENLPDGIDPRFIEKTLFYNGLVVFFNNPDYDKYFALKGSGSGPMNAYDNYTEYTIYGNGIRPRRLKYTQRDNPLLKECVPIWANYTRQSNAQIVAIYAKRLARVDRTIDINVLNSRHPKVFKGSDNLRLSAINMSKQLNSGTDFLMVTEQLADAIEVLDMGIDVDGFDKLHTLRARLYNECMGFLGIDNANQDKKERLIEGEVEANEEQVDVTRAVAMNAREEAVDEINRLYPDLRIRVSYRGKSNALDMQASQIGESNG